MKEIANDKLTKVDKMTNAISKIAIKGFKQGEDCSDELNIVLSAFIRVLASIFMVESEDEIDVKQQCQEFYDNLLIATGILENARKRNDG